MDGSRFDTLVRHISTDASRRGLLRSAIAATFAGLGLTAILGTEETEAAKSCKKKCKQKNSSSARKKCKKKCNQQNPPTPPGGKTPGTLCEVSTECAPPFTCALPLNDSGGDKRCCGQTGAPCGGDNTDLDDLPPICCQGFVCSTDGLGTSTPGTCQPAP